MDYARAQSNQAGAFSAQQTDATCRQETELEAFIHELRGCLNVSIESARAIFSRVLPPMPTPAGQPASTSLGTVETTYADKMRSVNRLADELRGLLGQLNGHI